MKLALFALAQIALLVAWYIVPTLPVWLVFLPTFAWLGALLVLFAIFFVTVAFVR